jgi:Flp pilus assembly protein TadB
MPCAPGSSICVTIRRVGVILVILIVILVIILVIIEILIVISVEVIIIIIIGVFILPLVLLLVCRVHCATDVGRQIEQRLQAARIRVENGLMQPSVDSRAGECVRQHCRFSVT